MNQAKSGLPWSQAKSLKDTVIEMVKKGQTQSPEFQILLEFFGREKLERFWKEYQAEVRAQEKADKPT